MNDRPISANEDSVNDLSALTPSMLLTFQRRPSIPAGILGDKDAFSRRWWRQAQHLANNFWKRWVAEYVPTLHLRQKWTHKQPSLAVGDLVLIAEEFTQRGDWPMGRVTEVIQSIDGLVRAAKVSFKGKTLTRPITKLCLLEQHGP